MPEAFLYIGASIIFLWGLGHLIPTPNVVAGFGELSSDNQKIITMEWIAEGLTLIFLGVSVFLFSILFGVAHPATHLTARIGAGMLVVLAVLSALTGARIHLLPMKLCPFIKSLVAFLYLGATLF